MIITIPKSLRRQEEVTPSYYEDHLIERVSVLEFRVAQLAEQLAMGYEFISRQSKTAEEDHLLMQSFFESLEEIKPEISGTFANEFSRNLRKKKKAKKSANQTRKMFDAIIAAHNDANIELFTHLVWEGIGLLNRAEEKQAFKTLERANLLSPENSSLMVFLGEKLFRAGEIDQAVPLLENAYRIAPQNVQTLILLGVIFADSRKAEKARKFLSVLVGNSSTSVCANYVWGMLAAFEGSWQEALIAFKQASCETESAELQYLIGCAYFELSDYQNALLSIEKAVLADPNFADASFMQSVIYEKIGEPKLAKLSRETAFEAKEPGAVCSRFLNTKKEVSVDKALSFLHFSEKERRILTGGSLRMRNFLDRLASEVTG